MRVRFVAQAWVRNYATEIDPSGPVLYNTRDEYPIEDDDTKRVSDDARLDAFAPEWVRHHTGPFDIYCYRPDLDGPFPEQGASAHFTREGRRRT